MRSDRPGRHARRLRRASETAVAVALVALSFTPAPAAHAASEHPTGAPTPVIVEGSSALAATVAVQDAGGTVDLSLPLVSGVAAHVPAGALDVLRDQGLLVTPDVTLRPTGASFQAVGESHSHGHRAHSPGSHSPGSGTPPTPSGPTLDPQLAALDVPGSWSPSAGRGVAVALVDTGVSDTPDLHGSRLVRGPDLSGEGDGLDHYGHGTFMAGLIAGDGTASATSTTPHYGVAPGATLVSVKVAGADGSTTVSRIIAAIGWIVVNRDTYGIGVLNLSFGVDAPVPYAFNPLSAAVEAAWASGITVVVAAGNDGAGHVTSPGSDPYVVTVGAADTQATASTADDQVTSWSGREQFRRFAKPEVVAPGVSVVSLRAPGSTIDTTHPEGRVDDVYFRGSGTSMSTALVSGAAALLLAHHPAATPDDVKGALVDGANHIDGHGHEIDLAQADTAPARPDWWQHFRVAFDGLGLGLHDGMPWTAVRWTSVRWTAVRWTSAPWSAVRWTDAEWAASPWMSVRWTSVRWTSVRWTAEAWPSQGWG